MSERVSRLSSHLNNNTSPFEIRDVQESDYHKNLIGLLSQLTKCPDVSYEQFTDAFQQRSRSNIRTLVIEDTSIGRVVASGSLVLERKFVHSCGVAGHIEDVVVCKDYRGKDLGSRVVHGLIERAKDAGCYKVILDCSVHNVPFYNKMGFQKKEEHLALYLTDQ
jgi:glucosamine-phosphate N-acetyltransferase